ncbi:MAG TPA: hypothetical protein VJX74_19075 [Blastocatellia bacterium]|nr:hypothetical protein [Blastocatellia bacterium]
MLARQIAKQRDEKNEVVKPESRKTSYYHLTSEDEAPVIIKGSSQGPEIEIQPWSLASDVKLLERSVGGEYVYTLPNGFALGGFVILDSKGARIFEFPNSAHSGDYSIEFFKPKS